MSAEFHREIQFGDVGKFVAQAQALGIHHLAEPAQRPTLAVSEPSAETDTGVTAMAATRGLCSPARRRNAAGAASEWPTRSRGYTRYGAQGGDWGSGITRWLASSDGAHCIGGRSSFPGGNRPTDDPLRGVTQAEIDRLHKRNEELADQKAYGAIQGTRPLTLAYGLNDSPAGLAAWIVDKFWNWSDHGGRLENSFSKDELLTNVMLYWVTQSRPSATRIHYESQHNLPRPPSMTTFTGGDKPAPLALRDLPKGDQTWSCCSTGRTTSVNVAMSRSSNRKSSPT